MLLCMIHAATIHTERKVLDARHHHIAANLGLIKLAVRAKVRPHILKHAAHRLEGEIVDLRDASLL